MPLHDATLKRETVMEAFGETVAALEQDELAARTVACDARGVGTADWRRCRDAMLEDLLQAVPPDRAPAVRHQIELLDRAVDRAFVDPEDRAAGFILPCVSWASTDCVLEA